MLGATAACHFSTIVRHLHVKKWPESVSFLAFWLQNVLLATAACNFSTSQLQKVVRECCVLYILTCKCASRHSGVQFFHIATSKSGPRPSVFYDFDLNMCFSPQRRAIFPHRNFKKWSEPVARAAFCLKMCFSLQRRAIFPHRNFKKWSENAVFCTFWLANVLLATAACNFSFPSWKATSAPAALARLLFDPADPQIIEKTQHFATSLTFRACWSSFFPHLLIFFLAALLFQLSILSEVRLLNFLWLFLYSTKSSGPGQNIRRRDSKFLGPAILLLYSANLLSYSTKSSGPGQNIRRRDGSAILLLYSTNTTFVFDQKFGSGAEHPAPRLEIFKPSKTTLVFDEYYFCIRPMDREKFGPIRRRDSKFLGPAILFLYSTNTTFVFDQYYFCIRPKVRVRGRTSGAEPRNFWTTVRLFLYSAKKVGPGGEHPAPRLLLYSTKSSGPGQNIRPRDSPFWVPAMLLLYSTNITRNCTHRRTRRRRRRGGGGGGDGASK